MSSSSSNDGFGGRNGIAKSTTGQHNQQQTQQPVVSLLEKYSSLHRGIDEARKEYGQKQLEIESIEADILRLVDVDRPETETTTEKAIRERGDLLQTLETLTTEDLVDAQDMEFWAQKNLDLARSKEEKTMRAAQEDDRSHFLLACEAFREKIRILSLRGKLFGLKTPVAPIGAYIVLSRSRSALLESERMDETESMGEDNIDNCNHNDENFQLIDDSLLTDTSIMQRNDHGSNNYNDDDEEIHEMLRQLQKQKENTEKYQKVWQEEKQKQLTIQEARDKRDKQKRDLQSQCERLQQDVRGVQSQIEHLEKQTREANESTVEFRNDLGRHSQSQASGTNAASRATERAASAAGTDTTVTVDNRHSSTTMARNAPIAPYNPYAQTNRRKNATSTAILDPTGTARTISPVVAAAAAAETPNRSRKNPRSKNNKKNNGKRSRRTGGGGNSKRSPSVSSPASRDLQQYPHHRSGQILRSSRHFGGGSFRPPDEFLMRLAATNSSSINTSVNDNTNSNQNQNQNSNNDKQNGSTPSETTPESLQERKGQKRVASSIRYQIEDTNDDDDEDDDDDEWLDAAPTFFSSKRK